MDVDIFEKNVLHASRFTHFFIELNLRNNLGWQLKFTITSNLILLVQSQVLKIAQNSFQQLDSDGSFIASLCHLMLQSWYQIFETLHALRWL